MVIRVKDLKNSVKFHGHNFLKIMLLRYRTDFNAVPPVSILQPIDTYLVHFLNKRVPKLQARDAGIWWGTLPKMQLMLRKASHTLYVNGKMTHEQMHNYHMAVTEREVSYTFIKLCTLSFTKRQLLVHEKSS